MHSLKLRKLVGANDNQTTMAHHSSVITKQWKDNGHIGMPLNPLVPPQYSAPPPPSSTTYYHHQHTITYQQYQQQYPSSPSCGVESNSANGSSHHIPDTHKSMWAVNPLYTSNSGKQLSVQY